MGEGLKDESDKKSWTGVNNKIKDECVFLLFSQPEPVLSATGHGRYTRRSASEQSREHSPHLISPDLSSGVLTPDSGDRGTAPATPGIPTILRTS